MKQMTIILLPFVLLAGTSSFSQSPGWIAWRGPSADGTSPETNWNLDKIRSGKALLWRTNVGTGHSTVAVVGEKVYTMGNFEVSEGEFHDRVVCLDAASGEVLWNYDIAMPEGEDPGPFSSPVVDDTRLYTLSRGGHLHCFDAEKGEVIWMKNLVEEDLIPEGSELACSPLILDDRLILNINQNGLALNKRTGEKVWTSEKDKSSLSTAVLFRINGKKWVTIQDNDETLCVDPETGRVLWSVPVAFISDPLIVDNKMLVFSYKGSVLYDISTNPPVTIWNNPLLKARFQSFVKHGDYVYGFIDQGGDRLICADFLSGQIIWTQKVSLGALILSNGTLIVIDKEGVLRFIDASPEGYNERLSAQVMNLAATDAKGRGYRRISGCWTNPVLCDGRIYLRSTYGELVCLDVSAD